MISIPVTISDVAKAAKVSITTVSYVINNVPKVGENTRQRVLKVMEELNYRPSRTARALAGSRTNSIGLVIPSITASFYISVVSAIEDVVVKKGLVLTICMSRAESSRERAAIELLKDASVDGMILMTFHVDEDYLVKLHQEGETFVTIGDPVAADPIFNITVDNYSIGYTATEELITLGHRDIAIITGVPDAYDSRERLRGYMGALKAHGIVPRESWVREGLYSIAGGKEAARDLFGQELAPTAIFAANDLMAFGAIEVAGERGLSVPSDLSVIGVDDIEASSIIHPKLTTVKQPTSEMGDLAVNMLLKLIDGDTNLTRKTQLNTELIRRESCAQCSR